MQLFLDKEFQEYGKVYVATEDGSAGIKGNVLDAIREEQLAADVIYACGPKPMLRAIKAYALEQRIPCWISMEERMACGDRGMSWLCMPVNRSRCAHSHVHNKRVCKDGPVFLSYGGGIMMNTTSDNLAGVELKNPVMTASGTFGSGQEYSEFVDLNTSWGSGDEGSGKCTVARQSGSRG